MSTLPEDRLVEALTTWVDVVDEPQLLLYVSIALRLGAVAKAARLLEEGRRFAEHDPAYTEIYRNNWMGLSQALGALNEASVPR